MLIAPEWGLKVAVTFQASEHISSARTTPSAKPTITVRAVLSSVVGRYSIEHAGLPKPNLYSSFFCL